MKGFLTGVVSAVPEVFPTVSYALRAAKTFVVSGPAAARSGARRKSVTRLRRSAGGGARARLSPGTFWLKAPALGRGGESAEGAFCQQPGKGARQQLCGFLARLLLLVGSAEGRAGPPPGAPPSRTLGCSAWGRRSRCEARGEKTTAALAGSACKRIRSGASAASNRRILPIRSEQGSSARGAKSREEAPSRSVCGKKPG